MCSLEMFSVWYVGGLSCDVVFLYCFSCQGLRLEAMPLFLHVFSMLQAVSFLMHPKSPIGRLLVDHPTGSGKTREMIKAVGWHLGGGFQV